MREIKFRAKSLDGIWEYGDLHLHCKHPYIYNMNGAKIYIDENTVGQFTGLHDKNGKEIYEGDIIQLNYPQWNNVVFWNDNMLCFEYRRIGQKQSYSLAMNELQLRYYEVVSSIHDNPELLKGE